MKQLTPRWIALLAITGITLYVVWLVFQPFVQVLLWAMVLAVIASPVNNLFRRWGRSPNVSAMLTMVVVLLMVVLPSVVIINAAASHMDEAVTAVKEGVSKLTHPDSPVIKYLGRYGDVGKYLQGDGADAQIKRFGDLITSQGLGLVGGGILILVQGMLVLFTTYYMLRDSGKLLAGVRAMLPLTPAQTDAMIANIRTIISASLQGTVLISAIQGILGGLAFWVLGLPAALIWGALMFIASMIPVVGSSLIWIPAALYLLSDGHTGKALILTAWGVGVIAAVDNVLRPPLVGSKTRMHELTVFFSVLGGLQLFGPVGIVAGPIVVGVAVGVLRIFLTDETAEKAVPQLIACNQL